MPTKNAFSKLFFKRTVRKCPDPTAGTPTATPMVVVTPSATHKQASANAANDLKQQLVAGPGSYLSRSQDSLSPAPQTSRKASTPLVLNRTTPTSNLGLPKVNSASGSLGVPTRGCCKSAPSTPIKEEDSQLRLRKTAPNNGVSNVHRPARRAASQQADARINKTKLTVTELQKAKRELEAQLAEFTKKADSKQVEIATLKMELRAEKEAKELALEQVRTETESLRRQLWQLGITDDSKQEAINRANALTLQPVHVDRKGVGDCASADAATSPMVTRKSLTAIDIIEEGQEEDNDGSAGSAGADWDKQSTCSQLSEVSLACLQDRIVQMEETHHSTNEELQATLQELTDLQDIVDELVKDNQSLAEENKYYAEMKEEQARKLDQYRLQIENMKHLLLSANNTNKASEREQKLVDLLRSMAEEHEDLKARYLDVHAQFTNFREEAIDKGDMVGILGDRNRLLETQLDTVLEEREKLENRLLDIQRKHEKDIKENQRLLNALEKERMRVDELFCQLQAEGTGELQQLLDSSRREKDRAEERCSALEETLAKQRALCEQHQDKAFRLERQVQSQEKCALDITVRIETLENEVETYKNQAMEYRASALELDARCSRLNEDKKEYKAQILSLQSAAAEIAAERDKCQKEVVDLNNLRQAEIDDWRQFQADLQTAVVVANDFKVEAQNDIEVAREENAQLRERLASLNAEFDRLKSMMRASSSAQPSPNSPALKSRLEVYLRNASGSPQLLNSPQSHTTPGKRFNMNPIANVKSLIENMEKDSDHNVARMRNGVSTSYMITSPPHQSVLMRSPGSVTRHNVQICASSEDNLPKSVFERPTSVSAMEQLIVKRPTIKSAISETHVPKLSVNNSEDTSRKPSVSDRASASAGDSPSGDDKAPRGILVNGPVAKSSANKSAERKAAILDPENKDPLAKLMKDQPRGSRRNALLKWCQQRVRNYQNVEITNFSSSWNDGLAFCALLHSFMPQKIPYATLDTKDKQRNFSLAFGVAECLGICPALGVDEMIGLERPDWQMIMTYVTSIYKLIET